LIFCLIILIRCSHVFIFFRNKKKNLSQSDDTRKIRLRSSLVLKGKKRRKKKGMRSIFFVMFFFILMFFFLFFSMDSSLFASRSAYHSFSLSFFLNIHTRTNQQRHHISELLVRRENRWWWWKNLKEQTIAGDRADVCGCLCIRRTLSKEFPMLVFDVERKQKEGKNNNDEDA